MSSLRFPQCFLLIQLLFLCLLALTPSDVNCAIKPPIANISYPVWVKLSFNRLSKVDGVEQNYRADFYMRSYWYDPAFQPFLGQNYTTDSVFDKSSSFTPQLEFVNAYDEANDVVPEPYSFVTTPDFITNTDLQLLGIPLNKRSEALFVLQDSRIVGDFSVELDLEDFPWDSQAPVLHIESLFTADILEIRFILPAGGRLNDIRPQTAVIGWGISNAYIQSSKFVYSTLGPDAVYSRLSIGINLIREPQYYLAKIILGCILLVLMCMWVFSLAVDEADRMMGTLSVFAGLVTYLFVASGDVPKVPYQTRLDSFFNFSFFMVAFIMFIHGALYWIREEDDGAEAPAVHHDASLEPNPLHSRNQSIIELSSRDKHSGSVDNGAGLSYRAGARGSISTPSGGNTAAGRRNTIPLPRRGWDWSGIKDRLYAWWDNLVFTRKMDVLLIPTLFTIYIFGLIIIFARPTKSANLQLQ